VRWKPFHGQKNGPSKDRQDYVLTDPGDLLNAREKADALAASRLNILQARLGACRPGEELAGRHVDHHAELARRAAFGSQMQLAELECHRRDVSNGCRVSMRNLPTFMTPAILIKTCRRLVDTSRVITR